MKKIFLLFMAICFILIADMATAQDLPRNHFKVIGYHSTVVMSIRDEIPIIRNQIFGFWG